MPCSFVDKYVFHLKTKAAGSSEIFVTHLPYTTRQYVPKYCNLGSVTWLVNQLICLDFGCNVGELSELGGESSHLLYSHTWQLLIAQHNWVQVLVYLNSSSSLKSPFARDCVRIYCSIIWQTAWYKKQNIGKHIYYWKYSNNQIFAKKWDGLGGPEIWALFYPAVASADIITSKYWWVLQTADLVEFVGCHYGNSTVCHQVSWLSW